MWTSGSRKEIIPYIKSKIPIGNTILDAGCGDGYASSSPAQIGYNVIGVDISDEMVSYAKQICTKEIKVEYLKGSLDQLPIRENTIDTVLAFNSMEWTESPLQVLFEFNRVLKKRGSLIIGILGPTAGPRINSYPRLYGKDTICNTIMPWELERLAKENGWNLIDGFPVYKEKAKSINTD